MQASIINYIFWQKKPLINDLSLLCFIHIRMINDQLIDLKKNNKKMESGIIKEMTWYYASKDSTICCLVYILFFKEKCISLKKVKTIKEIL